MLRKTARQFYALPLFALIFSSIWTFGLNQMSALANPHLSPATSKRQTTKKRLPQPNDVRLAFITPYPAFAGNDHAADKKARLFVVLNRPTHTDRLVAVSYYQFAGKHKLIATDTVRVPSGLTVADKRVPSAVFQHNGYYVVEVKLAGGLPNTAKAFVAPNLQALKKMSIGRDMPAFNTNNSANFDVTVNNPANLTYDYKETASRTVIVHFVAVDGSDSKSISVTVPANSYNGNGTIPAGTLLHDKNYSVVLNSYDVIDSIWTAP